MARYGAFTIPNGTASNESLSTVREKFMTTNPIKTFLGAGPPLSLPL